MSPHAFAISLATGGKVQAQQKGAARRSNIGTMIPFQILCLSWRRKCFCTCGEVCGTKYASGACDVSHTEQSGRYLIRNSRHEAEAHARGDVVEGEQEERGEGPLAVRGRLDAVDEDAPRSRGRLCASRPWSS
jgi:hypothetical protein